MDKVCEVKTLTVLEISYVVRWPIETFVIRLPLLSSWNIEPVVTALKMEEMGGTPFRWSVHASDSCLSFVFKEASYESYDSIIQSQIVFWQIKPSTLNLIDLTQNEAA